MLTIIERDSKVLGIHRGRGQIVGDEIRIRGKKVCKPASRVDIHFVPDQDISQFYREDAQRMKTIVAQWPDDFQQFTIDEQEALIDRETEEAINEKIHCEAPIGEQFTVLREQLTQILADSGKQPIKRFRVLTDIAEAEIAKGQIKKDALRES